MAGINDFTGHTTNLDSPALNAAAVTPHDTNELANYSRGIYVGGAGNLVVVLVGDSAAVTFVGVPAGTLLPIRAKIVKSTSTTATSIVALY
jgi:hypothetical protein